MNCRKTSLLRFPILRVGLQDLSWLSPFPGLFHRLTAALLHFLHLLLFPSLPASRMNITLARLLLHRLIKPDIPYPVGFRPTHVLG
jgi:hypothetical protein